ncbi:MAG: PDZ domain-containing protein [Planctomycetes bacterium]|nr:PDZ domain-containing protein [Planctomycetota bacterium]
MHNNLRFILTSTAICTAMFSSTVMACLDDEQERRVIRSFVFSPDGENHTFSTSKTIEIRDVNGILTVVIDGKEIPTDQIKKEGGKIKILDEDGNELPMFGISIGGGKAGKGMLFNLRNQMGEGNDAHTMMQWFGGDFTPPKVMLGVQLSQTSKALEYHLGLDAGTTTMLTQVFEDLGAAEAGLQKYDIIVSINGQTPADPASVRALLADKEPGDEITLSVIHQGKKRKANVQLKEYDRGRFRTLQFQGFGENLHFGSQPFFDIKIDLERDPEKLRGILIDPLHGNVFRPWFGEKDFNFEFSDILLEKLGEDFGDDIKLKLRMHIPNEDELQESRAEAIHEHIQRLQKLLNELVEQARTLEDDDSDI